MSDAWTVWLPVGGLFVAFSAIVAWIWWSEYRRYKRNPPPWLLQTKTVHKVR